MWLARLLGLVLLAGLLPRMAAGQPADVDHAAEKARQGVRSIVKRLSGRRYSTVTLFARLRG
jgi:hypothetical protein